MPKTRPVPKRGPRSLPLERELEDLLYTYPYLLEPVFDRFRRQRVLRADSRLDLLFEGNGESVIIEIKRGTCGVAEVRQIERYLAIKQGEGATVRGILVGAKLTAPAEKARVASRYPICFKQKEKDVPTRVVICRDCRRARSVYQARCSWCRCRSQALLTA